MSYRSDTLYASGSVTFPLITSLLSNDQTINVAGAAVGSPVILGLPAAPTAGIIYNAFVSSTGVVTVRAFNFTLGSITPGATAITVTVFKALT